MFRCQMEKPVGIPAVCRHSDVEVVREPCLCGSLCHLFMHLFSILNTPPFSGSQVFINIPVGLGNSIRCKLKTAPADIYFSFQSFFLKCILKVTFADITERAYNVGPDLNVTFCFLFFLIYRSDRTQRFSLIYRPYSSYLYLSSISKKISQYHTPCCLQQLQDLNP